MQSESLNADIFKFLLLLGRPASGKSEFIDFMEKCPLERRMTRYHLGELHIIDDFVMLWEKFEEDDLWEKLGHRRLFSKRVGENYTVIDHRIWPFLIEKINVHAEKFIKATPNSLHRTVLIEFSRGGKTGYADALNTLSPEILSHTAILYIHVSPEESRRRNIARYDEKKKESILAHSVPHDEMERTYAKDDWRDIASKPAGWLLVNDIRLPYVTMNNEPESKDPVILDQRYHEALETLHRLCREKNP
jgi:hypothetical protein